jgi:peptidoglycan/LPS O-acetylase OafA/YrhL
VRLKRLSDYYVILESLSGMIACEEFMSITYRSEIDGIRAIAVLAVVIYHLDISFGQISILPGGFLGVDVFFVISGFLITAIINKELKTNNSFSFLGFYERRIRRLIPALLIVSIVCLFIQYFLLLPYQAVDFSESVLSTLVFGANFYWDHNLQQYGAESAKVQPFLNMWSLGVEEQYYLVFPFLFLMLQKNSPRIIHLAFIVALVCSFLLAIYASSQYPSFSFYMLPTRFWELLSGGLAALYVFNKREEKLAGPWSSTMPSVGFLMILIPLLVVDHELDHPGLVTVFPVIGTIFLIIFANDKEPFTKLLKIKFLTWTGLISYSLYLWHYPIFSFGWIVDPSPTWHDKVQWVVLSVVFASITYKFIEKPSRIKRNIKTQNFMVLMVIGYIIVGSYCIYLIQSNKGFQDTFEKLMSNREDWSEYGYKVCDHRLEVDCSGFDENEKTVMIVGDSMAPDALRAIAKNYPEYNYILSSGGGCFPSKEVLPRENKKAELRCKRLNEKRFNPQILENIDGVIILTINYRESYVDKRSALNQYISFLKENGVPNVIILGNYIHHSPRLYDLYMKEHGNKDQILKKLEVNLKDNDQLLMDIADENNIEFISVRDVACDANRKNCKLFIGNTPYSWDNHHWSVEFTDYLADELSERLSRTWLATDK